MSKPNQDALALAVSYVPDLGHFVAGPNAELLDHVRRIGKEASGFRSLHLWGVEGAGKSFLCECVRSMASTSQRLEIHDDIDKASVKEQEQYLHAFNQLQATRQGLWLSTSRQTPGQLPLLADLRSRLSWGLVYELKTLADEDKLTALCAWSQERGLPLAADVLPWLLRHESRNLAHLTSLLLEFDRFALQSKRSLSLTLLRQCLQERGSTRPKQDPLG